jgi:cell division septal protein FtsQ
MYKYKKLINWKGSNDRAVKSTRDIAYSSEKKVKKIVKRGLLILITIYLIYLFLLSKYFTITNINIAVEDPEFNTEELINYINNYLNGKTYLIFHNSNYFLFSKSRLKGELTQKYLIEELTIKKEFPHTLNISFEEKIANLLLQTNDINYLIDLEGKITTQVGERLILNEKNLPKIIDESNSDYSLGQTILTPSLISLVINLFQEFNNYIPDLQIVNFRIVNSESTFIKAVTAEGVEIHLNDRLSMEEQLNKLKAALESEMINLNNVSYINLRIKDQVIYK